MATILHTEQVPIDSIYPYPGNARRGKVATIKGSLQELNQYRPLVVQQSTSYILAGNHTWMAMKEDGFAKCWVTWIDCTDAEALKINLVDNKANDGATYDNVALAELLGQLEGDFTGTGFSEDEFTKLLDSLAPKGHGDAGEGSAFGSEPRTTYGDIWYLGPHRLLCGDATELGDLALLLGGEQASLVVTSPPYNQGLDKFKPSGMQKENPAWVQRMAGAYDDSRPEPEYQAEQIEVLRNLWDVVTDNGAVFYNHKPRYRDKAVVLPTTWLYADNQPWTVRQELIWDRQGSITLNARMFMPCDERIYWLTRGDEFLFNDTPEIKAWSSVWDIAPRVDANVTAPFPTELPSRCIQACSMRGDIVLDPYAGSGTTLIAAEHLGRRGYMLELNPAYCDVIISRWEAISGMTATLEDNVTA